VTLDGEMVLLLPEGLRPPWKVTITAIFYEL
jgi:hypothetical protein